MAISKAKKETIVKGTGDILKNDSLFFVDFSQAKTMMVNKFKKTIRAFGGTYTMVKKNLLKVALKQAGRSVEWLEEFHGTVGMVYASQNDAQSGLAKAIQKFIKDNNTKVKTKDSLTIVGGYLGAELWTRDQVIRLAQIPAKEVLHGQLVNIISYPIAGFAQTLAGVLQQFLLTLVEVGHGKSKSA